MSDTSLSSFLGKSEDEPDAAPTEEDLPEPDAEAEPEAEEPEPEGEAEPEAPPEPNKGGRNVPLSALESERAKRHEQRERAVRAETELELTRKQLEEFRRGPPAPPAAPEQYQPIDPSVDPQGFVQRVQQVAISTKLDVSEMMLRKEIGAEKVDALIAEFKEAAKEDPGLFTRLYSQQHPYEWAHQQIEARRLQREIGSDPASYRSKLEAEIRAQVLAEQGAASPPPARVSPAAGMQPSLGAARSVASRMVVDDSDMPIGDILRR